MSRLIPLWTAAALALAPSSALPWQGGSGFSVAARITVGGGPLAGSYPLQSEVIDCRLVGPLGTAKRDFTVDFGFFRSDPRSRNPRTLNHIRLEIPGVLSDGEFRKFYLEATFGDLSDPGSRTMQVVNTRSADGRTYGNGTVTLNRTGKAGRLVIDAQTRDGVKLSGTIDCAKVGGA